MNIRKTIRETIFGKKIRKRIVKEQQFLDDDSAYKLLKQHNFEVLEVPEGVNWCVISEEGDVEFVDSLGYYAAYLTRSS